MGYNILYLLSWAVGLMSRLLSLSSSHLEMCAVRHLLGAFGGMLGGSPHFLFILYKPCANVRSDIEMVAPTYKCTLSIFIYL